MKQTQQNKGVAKQGSNETRECKFFWQNKISSWPHLLFKSVEQKLHVTIEQ
jgi:hypothetical protein